MVEKYYTKLWSFICDKISYVGTNSSKYSRKTTILFKIRQKTPFSGSNSKYLISEKKDENGCVMVYSPTFCSRASIFGAI